MRRIPLAPVILALLLAEALVAPLDEFVSLLADAPYVRLLPGAERGGGILDSVTSQK
jgi:hypothetical protein